MRGDEWRQLRERAESRLGQASAEERAAGLDQELQVQRAELELQNDELVLARRELEASRDRYRALFEYAPVGYVILDAASGVRQANWSAELLLGVPESASVGRSFEQFAHPDDVSKLQRHLHQVMNDRVHHEIELRLHDGRWARIVSTPLSQGSQMGSGCSVALLDVTERRAAQEAAQQREERLQSIFDTAVDGIITTDGDGTVKSANRTVASTFGWDPEDLVGQPISVLIAHDEDGEHGEVAGLPWEAREPPEGPQSRETRGWRHDGTTFPLEIRVGPRGVTHDRGWTVILRDLSARKELEAELRHAQKMEAVGRLAAGVAHDFNNLLMGMLGGIDVALQQLEQGQSPQTALQQVRRSVKTGAGVVDQLMAFSRKRTDESQPAEIDVVLSRTETILRRMRGDRVSLQVRRGAPRAFVKLEESSIEQLILNLAVNALDAIRDRGNVTVETHLEQLGGEQADRAGLTPGSYVVLEVRDDGKGMDEDTRARIFEPFFTTKSADRGTGLGLSTVYGIVNQAGGSILVDTEVGRGTRLRMYLPQREARAEAVSEPPAETHVGAPGQGELVLVVEDDRGVRAAVVQYLERNGYRVLEAPDARAAERLVAARNQELALAVVDVALPQGETGIDLVHRLHETRPQLPVLYISAHPRHVLSARGLFPHGAALLQKPFEAETLLREVRQAIGEVEGTGAGERISVVRAGSSSPQPASVAPHTVVGDAGGASSATVSRSEKVAAGATSAPERLLLLVDDDDNSREALQELLAEELDDPVWTARNAAEARQVMQRHGDAIVLAILDYRLPDEFAPELVAELRAYAPEASVLYLSGAHPESDTDLEHAVQETRASYASKPVSVVDLVRQLRDLLD